MKKNLYFPKVHLAEIKNKSDEPSKREDCVIPEAIDLFLKKDLTQEG